MSGSSLTLRYTNDAGGALVGTMAIPVLTQVPGVMPAGFQPGAGETAPVYTLTQLSTFFTSVDGPFIIDQGTITVSTPAFGNTATWNAGGVTFVNDFRNITSTASAAGSLLAQWQLDSANVFTVAKGGGITTAAGLVFATLVSSVTALATPSALAATALNGFASTVSGATLMGYGTTGDVTLKNRAGTDVLVVTANTLNVTLAGALAMTGALSGVTSAVYSTLLSSVTALATPSALAATALNAFASTVSGAVLMGYGTTADVTLKNRAGTDVLKIGPNTTAAVLAGTLSTATTVGVGAATPAASGAGVTFPATQSASTDLNTLDDYEEDTTGTVVTMVPSTSGTITLNATFNKLYYTKIGCVVHITGRLLVDSVSSPVGTLQVQGLPFTSRATAPRYGFGLYAGGLEVTAITSIQGYMNENATQFQLERYAAGVSAAMAGDVKAGSEFYFSFSYFSA